MTARSQVQFVMDADEGKAVQGFLKLVESMKKGETQAQKLTAEQRKLEKAARDVFEKTRTPMEKHTQRMEHLNRLVKSGKIDQDTYRRAVDQSVDALGRHHKAGKKAHGTEAISNIKNMAAGYLSVAAAVGVVTRALQEQRRVQDEAGRRDVESRRGLGSLSQLANNKGEFKALVGKARQAVSLGAARTDDEGARFVFALESAGLGKDFGLFADLASKGVIDDPGGLATSIATLQASLGKRETGGARDIISKGFAASSFSPSTLNQLLKGASRAGTGAAGLGISDEETLAATAVLATARGSADEGGNRLAALFRGINKAGIGGRGLLGKLRNVDGSLTDAQLQSDVFGSAEAVEAFRILTQDPANLARITRSIGGAQSADLAGQKLSFGSSDARIAAAQRADVSAGRLASARAGRFGAATNILDTITNETVAARTAGGQGILGRSFDAARVGYFRSTRDDSTLLRGVFEQSLRPDANPNQADAADVLRNDPELQQRAADVLGEAAQAMLRAANKLESATDKAAGRANTRVTNQGE